MSLVNDALKRARMAQQPGPASSPPGPRLQPAETASSGVLARARLPWFTTIGAVFLGCLCLWQALRKEGSASPATLPTLARPVQSTLTSKPATPSPPIPSLPRSAPLPARTAPPQSAPPLSSKANPVTAAAPAPPVVAPALKTTVAGPVGPATVPPPLKLQAIVYDPKHPSAMISGRILFLGEKIGDLRLAALDRKSATLIGVGHTNVLTLK